MIGPFATFKEFETACGRSTSGGCTSCHHSPRAQTICKPIGDLAYEFVQAHLNRTSK